jgi:hypothetical protein
MLAYNNRQPPFPFSSKRKRGLDTNALHSIPLWDYGRGLRFWPTVGVATISTAETLVVETAPTVIEKAATAAVIVSVTKVASVGRFAASLVAAVVDGKAASAFPDKSIQ